MSILLAYLIVADVYSKWPEVVPMRKTASDKTINVLCGMFARWGIPHQLVSDNGPQFSSQRVHKIYCRMLNVGEHLSWQLGFCLMFAEFKFGECHVWRSIFVCKYYIW